MASEPTQWGSAYPGTDIVAEPEPGCVVEISGAWYMVYQHGTNMAGEAWFQACDQFAIGPASAPSRFAAPLLPSPAQATREQALAAWAGLCGHPQATGLTVETGMLILRACDNDVIYTPPACVELHNAAAVRRDLDKRDVLSAWLKQWDEVKHGEV